MTKRYASKVDVWLALLILVPGLVLTIIASVKFWSDGFDDPATLPLLGISGFYWGVLVALAYPVHYELSTTTLRIHSGWVARFTIVLEAIDGARPTRSPLSAAAWSLDRLRIDYRSRGRQRYTLISPAQRDAFLRDLLARCPQLTARDDTLYRRPS